MPSIGSMVGQLSAWELVDLAEGASLLYLANPAGWQTGVYTVYCSIFRLAPIYSHDRETIFTRVLVQHTFYS